MAKKPPIRYTGAPLWIVTFADLATLLLTFFVLLISFSNQDIIKFREMLGSVKGAFGVSIKRSGEFQAVLTGNLSPKEKKEEEKKKEQEENDKFKRQLEKMNGSMQKAVEESKMSESSEVVNSPTELRVRIRGETMFASGTYRLKPTAKKFLSKVAKIIRKSKFQLLVEGHTDNVPIRGGLYKSNWELSGARASAVVRYLISRNVAPNQLRAVGYAHMKPLDSNNTPKGRAKNRRVELLVKKFR